MSGSHPAAVLGERAASHAREAGLDPKRIPRHVAIIMDGNGRWATARGWDRTRGHRQGADVVRAITTESVALGVKRLTLYAFSSENWVRPQHEIAFLMGLLEDFLRSELPTLMQNQVRLEAIGRIERLTPEVRTALASVRAATADNDAMILSLALSYGGREEIVDACRALAAEAAAGRIDPAAIDEAAVQQRMYAGACPFGADDVDVVIRTAGEHRMSNFLLWQADYAEYVSVARRCGRRSPSTTTAPPSAPTSRASAASARSERPRRASRASRSAAQPRPQRPLAREDRHRLAAHAHGIIVRSPADAQIAAVEADDRRARVDAPAQDRRHRHRACPGAAGAGDPGAAFPGALTQHRHAAFLGQEGGELDIGPVGEARIALERRPPALERHALGVGDEAHRVRVAHADREQIQALALDLRLQAQERPGHIQADRHLGWAQARPPHVHRRADHRARAQRQLDREHPRPGLHPHRRCAHASALEGQLGQAADAVAAHLRLRSVGVEHRHAAVGAARGQERDQAVGAHPGVAVAHRPRQRGQIAREGAREAIEVDVVVAAAVHLGERQRAGARGRRGS